MTPSSRASAQLRTRLLTSLVAALAVTTLVTACAADEPDAPTQGEIFLVAANDQGADPFSADSLSPAVDASIAPAPTSTAAVSPDSSSAVTATAGSAPGLYGGSGSTTVCDPVSQAQFLAANPDKAAAWVAALTADSSVRLPDGSALELATVPAYIASLTPILLTQDTRVTNHGFRDGKPYTIQSVLQRGTAVMVDEFGVPRIKCNCGNPLVAPVASSVTPTYVGGAWPGFDPAAVAVVQPAPEPIVIYVIIDFATGQQVQLTAGSPAAASVPAPVAGGSATPAPETTSGSGTFSVAFGGIPVSDANAVSSYDNASPQIRFGSFAPINDETAKTQTFTPYGSVVDFTDTTQDEAGWFAFQSTNNTTCLPTITSFSYGKWTGQKLVYTPCTDANSGYAIDAYDVRVAVVSSDGYHLGVTAFGPGADSAATEARIGQLLDGYRHS